MEKVNVTEKFKQIGEYWKPYIADELNGQHVKLGKLKGCSSGITIEQSNRSFESR